jgi:galacturan 1,4-alpha-galacturonidase
VKPAHETRGDSAKNILKSFHDCNNGGTVVLDKVYWINSPIDLTFLRHVDMVITGEIHFDDSDVYYWNDNSFKYTFQSQSVFWKIGGKDVNIYGDLSNDQSLIDGHGQKYWEEIQTNKAVYQELSL